MTSPPSSRVTRVGRAIARRWRVIAAVAVAVLVAGVLLTLFVVVPWASRLAERHLLEGLGERFDSQVTLKSVRVSVFPRIRVDGEGLVVRHHGWTDVPPLIEVGRFMAEAPLSGLLAYPPRVRRVGLEGLHITMPPRRGGPRRAERGGCRGSREVDETAAGAVAGPVAGALVIGAIEARDASLDLVPRNPDKPARRFALHTVTLHDVDFTRPAGFEAVLSNPLPEGLVRTSGTFGPWNRGEPSLTPVAGDFTFTGADLATFTGIEGTLEAGGTYRGVLAQLIVAGDANVPDFRLERAGNAAGLRAEFDACVDGTDGDTYLDRVDARLRDTPIAASGKIEGRPGTRGRFIALDVQIDRGRVEDLVRLVVRGERSLVTGRLLLRAHVLLPPGRGDVVGRLHVNGRFGLEESRFAGDGVQRKIGELSRRGRGEPAEPVDPRVVSNLQGRFTLAEGVLAFPTLAFDVPGASVQLAGQYTLHAETLDFKGQLRLDAKVSETTTGVKSLLLKVVDPLFSRKGAGTVLPIVVSGTVDEPQFGVDVRKTILRKDD
jgi:hypothetical protein